jgi:hypothetical protein
MKENYRLESLKCSIDALKDVGIGFDYVLVLAEKYYQYIMQDKIKEEKDQKELDQRPNYKVPPSR